MRKAFFLVLLLAIVMVPGALAQDTAEVVTSRTSPPDPSGVQLVKVVDGLRLPLQITHAGDGSGRLFIATKNGDIWARTPDGEMHHFLNIGELLHQDSHEFGPERGMHAIAFHPNYAENGTFFVTYNDVDGDTALARYKVSDFGENYADPTSAEILFQTEQPHFYHNDAGLKFGSDGYLYYGLGDGGEDGDIEELSQNLSIPLGSILRLDVGATDDYAIPENNPFVDNPDALPEIWAYGLRNPWRFSFDRATGDLYIGDVGRFEWEEVNFVPAEDVAAGGFNFGWNFYEGNEPFMTPERQENDFDFADAPESVMPILQYPHVMDGGGNCAISGGYVYRGELLPELNGVYFYGDYCSGRIWAAYRDDSGEWQSDVFMDTEFMITTFGEDEAGELYVADYNGGVIYRFEPAS